MYYERMSVCVCVCVCVRVLGAEFFPIKIIKIIINFTINNSRTINKKNIGVY